MISEFQFHLKSINCVYPLEWSHLDAESAASNAGMTWPLSVCSLKTNQHVCVWRDRFLSNYSVKHLKQNWIFVKITFNNMNESPILVKKTKQTKKRVAWHVRLSVWNCQCWSRNKVMSCHYCTGGQISWDSRAAWMVIISFTEWMAIAVLESHFSHLQR